MKTTRCGFVISYLNTALLDGTITEIFESGPYDFSAAKAEPFIIDVGSNLGVSILYFKQQHPSAKILCFEPDPISYKLLEENVSENNLDNITLVNAAVAKSEGKVKLFGQIFSESPDSRGNSIVEGWANQRIKNDCVLVSAVRLSSYINAEVDVLKIDIEGAEQQVLEEIKDKLYLVRELFVEVHVTKEISHINSLHRIVEILKENNFDVSVERRDPFGYFPIETHQWISKKSPELFFVRAKRNTRT